MTSPRNNKKGSTSWIQCDNCKANIIQTNKDAHFENCPPNLSNVNHDFVFNKVLYGTVDIKANEEIKGISQHELNNMVFLSQSVIQLCDLSIGEYAIVSDNIKANARRVWPTTEKSLTSVLFTQNGLELTFKKECRVTISKLASSKLARKIVIFSLNKIEVSNDLISRLHKMHIGHLLTIGNKISLLYFGRLLHFEVKSVDPTEKNLSFEKSFDDLSIAPQFYEVTDNTIWNVFCNKEECFKELVKVNPFEKIGGLDKEISDIRDIINAALGKSRTLTGAIISRGILLYGFPGTGKTMLVNAFTSACNSYVVNINQLNLNSDAETIIDDVTKHAPSIIVIDEIDTICPARSSRVSETEKKTTANLLKLFDHINGITNSKMFVIAVSNKPDSIDQSFRRCGRLDREIEIPIPNPRGRLDILNKLLIDVAHTVNEDEFKEIANAAHGFVGTDLVALVSRAALHATTQRNGNKLSFQDLKFALTRVRPSAMREVQIEVPNVKWSDIGGQDDLKLILRQAVEWPLKHPASFIRLGITPPKGVLMFGPPGCSKTMIAKALATESGLNFLSIKGPELFSKWVGESERAVREVFRKARQVAPSVIFFDEIDALGGERSSGSTTSVQERVLAQLLTELDGVTPLGDVTVLAATNRPDRIDKALLRPGRLDRIVYVPLPDENTRREILKLKIQKMPVVQVDVEELVQRTKGYSGAEVNATCHEAAMKALEESLDAKNVEMRHFNKALEIVSPRTPSSLLSIYDEYLKH